MIAPEHEPQGMDLLGTLMAALIVMLGTWIFGQLLGLPLLRLIRALV